MKKLLLSLAALTMTVAPVQAQYRVETFNPTSFKEAFNRELSYSGRTVSVDHFESCGADTHWNDNYACYNGYITITDPRGQRICRVNRARYHGRSSRFLAENITGCVWSY